MLPFYFSKLCILVKDNSAVVAVLRKFQYDLDNHIDTLEQNLR
jgi:hypothetical protein